jgi:hypothetical protein
MTHRVKRKSVIFYKAFSKSMVCRITEIPQDILHTINGIEYCAVEITCDVAMQYGIQTYGEAIGLHKEALRHYE